MDRIHRLRKHECFPSSWNILDTQVNHEGMLNGDGTRIVRWKGEVDEGVLRWSEAECQVKSKQYLFKELISLAHPPL